MAIEDKLKYFYDSTMASIKGQGDDVLAKTRTNLEKEFEDYKKSTEASILDSERLEKDQIKREMLKALSNEKLNLRIKQAQTEEKIKQELFEEVTDMLAEYRKTDAYKDLLLDLIKCAVEFAGEDEIVIYMCPTDSYLKDEIEAKSGVSLIVSDVPFIGGIQAEIPSRNIFINNSFSSHVEEAKANYIVKA